MKWTIKKMVTTVCAGLAMFLISSQPAFAYTLKAVNPYSENLYIALIDFDDNSGQWCCHGWREVKAESTRLINIPSSTAQNHIYIYAYTANASWDGEGYDSSVKRTVIKEKFSYLDGEKCPSGHNGRQEYFKKYELYDGYLEWQP